MLKVDQEWIDRVDAQRPGFRDLVERWEAKDVPQCPSCGSDDTAEVSAGLVGTSMCLAGATIKIRLVANGHLADYYCNHCECYFDGPDGGHGRAPGGTYEVRFHKEPGRAEQGSPGRNLRA